MLYRWMHRIVNSFIIALLFACCLKADVFATGTEVTAIPGSDGKSVAITVKNPELAGKSVSVICYAPGWNGNPADLEGNLSYVAVLDQLVLDESGSAAVTYPLKEGLAAGTYTAAVGSENSSSQVVREFSVKLSGEQEACTHASTKVINKKAADCTAEGYTGDTVCEKCGKVITPGKAVAKTDHKYDAGVVVKQPTESQEGIKRYTCSVCRATKEEAIPKKSGNAGGNENTGNTGNKEDTGNKDNTGNTGTGNKPSKKKPSVLKVGTKKSDKKANAAVIVTKKGKIVNGKVTGAEVRYMKPVKAASKIVIPATVTIDGVSYKVTSIAPEAFKNNKKITQVTIGSNVKTIGYGSFSGCKNLKKVTIGKNVSTIYQRAFENCPKLTSVTMGAGVRTIGDRAFDRCSALKKITIPSKVTKIGKYAFYRCRKLRTVTIKSKKLKSVGIKAFSATHEKAVIKVPKNCYKKYKKFFTYKTGFPKGTMKKIKKG